MKNNADILTTILNRFWVGVVMVTILCCGCGCRSEKDTTKPPPAATITIGAIVPMEGPLWLYGREYLKGLNLAVKECNETGGVKGMKLSVQIDNDEGDPLLSAEAAKRMASDTTVIAVLGPVTSNNALAAAAVAQHEKLPLVLPYSTNLSVTEMGEFISRICFTDVNQARTLARYSFYSLGLRRVAILYEKDDAYSEGLSAFFEREFSALGGEISIKQPYSKRDSSYLSYLRKILDTRHNTIFLPGYYPQAAQLIRDVVSLNQECTFLGGDGWESLEKTELPLEVLDNKFPIYITSHFSHEDIRPAAQLFVQKYKEMYGTWPNSLSALAYDAAMLVINALERSSQLNRESLNQAIGSTREFPAATGMITINEKRNAIKPVYVLEMRGGKFHLRATNVQVW